MNLNKNQQEAVCCDLRPTIVIAGPGSGKTQVIVNRINCIGNTVALLVLQD